PDLEALIFWSYTSNSDVCSICPASNQPDSSSRCPSDMSLNIHLQLKADSQPVVGWLLLPQKSIHAVEVSVGPDLSHSNRIRREIDRQISREPGMLSDGRDRIRMFHGCLIGQAGCDGV